MRTIHDTMRELHGMPPAQALEEAIQRTNVVIYEASRKNHRLNGMGTTVVAAVIGSADASIHSRATTAAPGPTPTR